MLKKIKTTSKVTATKAVPKIVDKIMSTADDPIKKCEPFPYCDLEFNNENERKLVEYINKLVDKINKC